jgi:DnaJ-class molecular chaperone
METGIKSCWACDGLGTIMGCACRMCKGTGVIDLKKSLANIRRNYARKVRNQILREMVEK